MKNKLSPVFFTFSVCLLLLFSCRQGEVYDSFHQIERGAWDKNEAISFSADSLPLNPFKKYAVSLELTHDKRYPYQNIWLIVSTNFRDSVMRADTLEIRLSDKNGKWLGSGVGGLHQLSAPYKQQLTLDSVKKYHITVRHFMSEDVLLGVEKIGVKIIED